MAGGKLSPRQKMINMMYLVLTALLALNISKDILHALSKLNSSLEGTAQVVEEKNSDVYDQIEAAYSENPTKAGPARESSKKVRARSNQLVEEIETIKESLIEGTGGYDEAGVEPKKMDDKSMVANLMLIQGKAMDLRKMLDGYRTDMIKLVPDDKALHDEINAEFNTNDVKVGDAILDWEHATFEHYPLIAVLAFLTDYQAKIRNTEADIIADLKASIGASDLKFTGVRAIVMPKSNYVIQGDDYEADVFLAAYDETQNPDFIIDGQELSDEDIVGGVAKVRFPARAVGEKKWAGMIKLVTNGEIKEYPVEAAYNVAPPSVVISPTKMNVLYRGVDNPLDIGVPGVDPSKVKVSGPGVRSAGKGQYIADVSGVTQKTVTISVSVIDEEGKSKPMGKKEFRIKRVPDATGSQRGQKNTLRSAGFIKSSPVQADLNDFPFDLKLEVVSFEIVVPGFPPKKVRGNKLSSDVKQLIDKVKNGSTIVFRDIKAKGPKGLRVDVAGFSIDVNV